MKHGKIDHCWGCGAVTPFLCARCHKPVCVVMFSPTPDVGCGRLRRVRGQVGVFRLVHYPRCVGRRAPHVLAVINAQKRERDRLRDLLDRVHGMARAGQVDAALTLLNDTLNATPLDSPPGTASGFDHEQQRRNLHGRSG